MAFLKQKKTQKTKKTKKATLRTATVRYTKSAIKTKVKKGGRKLVSEALVKKSATNLRPKMHVNRGDDVVVISGSDKGKTGKVLQVMRATGKIIVEGINIRKRHKRAQGPGREGEIIEMESPIFASKVMIWDETSKKASRVAKKQLENGKYVRIAKTSGEQLD